MTEEAGVSESTSDGAKEGAGAAGGATAVHWLWLSLAVLAADQATKWVVTRQFELFESVAVNPYLDLTLLHNTGAAFSFLADAGGWQRWLFVGLGIVVSIVILVWLRRLPARGQSWLAIGLSLVMGGALGNVIDRVHYGYVIDFIHVHYQDAYFPAFNLADSAITVGAACLIIDALFFSGREDAGKQGGGEEA
ncbi:signal peptidase II [Lentisalinibacter salinarum]|uniref:signal peptidase II n=1 Tax=Lentisalinibacter salinarum TaxID=2992239 RepID=UPI00386C61E9